MKIFPRLFVLMAFVLCGVLYGTITPAQSDKDIGVVLGKASPPWHRVILPRQKLCVIR